MNVLGHLLQQSKNYATAVKVGEQPFFTEEVKAIQSAEIFETEYGFGLSLTMTSGFKPESIFFPYGYSHPALKTGPVDPAELKWSFWRKPGGIKDQIKVEFA